jgi:hypothetical protein
MGFLDKAKKLAEQAQTKLDEVQQQINTQGSSSSTTAGTPVTHYDQHGRPIPPEKTATPPHGDPIAATPGVPPTEPPSGPPTPTEGQTMPPAMPGAPPSSDDDPYAPPKLTGGDPLAG